MAQRAGLFPVIYVIHYSYRIYMVNLEAGKKQIELANALQQRPSRRWKLPRSKHLKTRFLASVSMNCDSAERNCRFAELLYDGVLGSVNDMQRECWGHAELFEPLRLLIATCSIWPRSSRARWSSPMSPSRWHTWPVRSLTHCRRLPSQAD